MSSYSDLTPFAAARVTNIVLQKAGLNVEVRPQMLYNYAKKGTIASNYESRAEGDKILFDGDAFKAWLDRYVERVKAGGTGTTVDYDKLAEMYM